MRDAFRIVPIHPDDIPLLAFSYDGALYLETRLPFGVRSGPAIYAGVAESIRDIQRRIISSDKLSNLLDDFFNFDEQSDYVVSAISLTGFRTC